MYKTRKLPNTRIDVADALRGIAVVGIILYHSVEHFNIFTQEPIDHALASDQTVANVLAWLLSGKMYGIFAMLFGLRTEFLYHERQPAAERKEFLGPFCLAYVPAVHVWHRQRGILRWRHPDALCLLWHAAHSHQLYAVKMGVVHHRLAGHPARRTLLLADGHHDRPQHFMGNVW